MAKRKQYEVLADKIFDKYKDKMAADDDGIIKQVTGLKDRIAKIKDAHREGVKAASAAESELYEIKRNYPNNKELQGYVSGVLSNVNKLKRPMLVRLNVLEKLNQAINAIETDSIH
jgi:hypothetical protein